MQLNQQNHYKVSKHSELHDFLSKLLDIRSAVDTSVALLTGQINSNGFESSVEYFVQLAGQCRPWITDRVVFQVDRILYLYF